MSHKCGIVDLEFDGLKKNIMVLDIAEIEYFFIVLELNKFEYLVFLFLFFYFLFRTKLLLISFLIACDRSIHQIDVGLSQPCGRCVKKNYIKFCRHICIQQTIFHVMASNSEELKDPIHACL